jgi:hypothetical protein
VTVGLPGTGLYWTERVPPAAPPHGGHRLAFAIAVGILLALAALVLLAGQ